MALAILALLGFVLARYGWASPAGPHGPAFLANKVIAMLALGCLGSGLTSSRREVRADHRRLGLSLLLAHGLLSLALLSPRLYAKLYSGGELGFRGEGALLAGALASGLFWNRLGPWCARDRRLAQVAMGLVALHLLAIGGPGWLHPGQWPAGLPPLTLWGFGFGVWVLARSLNSVEPVSPCSLVSPGGLPRPRDLAKRDG